MGRYLGPKCRLCRREGVKLYLKGERCNLPKCPVEKKNSAPPGVHKFKYKKQSAYGVQLREKQKLKSIYFVFEKQLKNYYLEALKTKGDSGEHLLQLLERRLDNVVYKAALAKSRMQARQLVKHGAILVDGKKVSIPSYQTKPGQVISLSAKSLGFKTVKEIMEAKGKTPAWMEKKAHAVKIMRMPTRDDIGFEINDQLIVEFYSR